MTQQIRRNIELTPEVFETIEALRSIHGMGQKAFLERILEYFAKLDEPAMQLVIGRLPAAYVEDAAERMKQSAIRIAAEEAEAGPNIAGSIGKSSPGKKTKAAAKKRPT